MKRIILLDLGSLVHTAIFNWNALKQKQLSGKIKEGSFLPPSSYTFFNMIIGVLRRIGINKDDTIILAGDGRNSWRKAFYSAYKEHREEFRKSHELIDWPKHYHKINEVINTLQEATNWNLIWLSNCWNIADIVTTPEGYEFIDEETIEDWSKTYSTEADDIIACIPRFFPKIECIIVSKDADLDMLTVLPNVKIFSLNVKWKGGTGVYKNIDNGFKVLEKKIRTGDISDNIRPRITDNNTEKDAKIRELIIDLINLPEWIVEYVKEATKDLQEQRLDFSKLPYQNSLAKRFPKIYEKDKVITYEDSIKRIERKKTKAKNKKAKLKKTLRRK